MFDMNRLFCIVEAGAKERCPPSAAVKLLASRVAQQTSRQYAKSSQRRASSGVRRTINALQTLLLPQRGRTCGRGRLEVPYRCGAATG
jgi:hypothetical protein